MRRWDWYTPTVVEAKGEDAYLIRVRIITLTPTGGRHFIAFHLPTAFTSLFIIDSYESVGALLMQGILGFALSVLNPQFWHPTDSTTRRCTIISCSLVESSIQQTAWSKIESAPRSSLWLDCGKRKSSGAVCPSPVSLFVLSGFGLILLSKPTMLPCCWGQLDVV